MPSEWRYSTALGRPWTMSQGPEKLLKTLKKVPKMLCRLQKRGKSGLLGLPRPQILHGPKRHSIYTPFWGVILALVEIIFSV